MQRLKRNYLFSGIIIFFILYTGALLILAKKTVLWEDEIYSLHTTSKSISYAIEQSYNFEGQPPFYFILLNLWRNISDSLFFARLLSLSFSLLSGVIIYKICKKFLDQEISIIFSFLFLLNPAIVYFSFEARLYSFIVFLSSSSIYLFYEAYLINPPKKNTLWLHAIVSLIGVFTQYFFVLLLLAQAFTLLLASGWKKLFKYSLIHSGIALIFSVNFFLIPDQVSAYRDDQLMYDPVHLKTFIRTLQNFIFSFNLININLILRRLIVIIYFGWLIILFKRVQFKVNSLIKTFKPVNFLIIITLLTYFSIVILFGFFRIDFNDRYIAILYPSLFLIFMFSLTLMKKYFLILASLLFIYYGIINYNAYSCFVKHFDYEQAARYVERIEKNNEPILFYLSAHALPFQYYYKGSNKIIPLPVPVDFNALDYFKNIYIPDTTFLNTIFKNELKSYNTFLFLSDNINSILGKSTNKQMINNYLVDKFIFNIDTLVKGRDKVNSFRVLKITRK